MGGGGHPVHLHRGDVEADGVKSHPLQGRAEHQVEPDGTLDRVGHGVVGELDVVVLHVDAGEPEIGEQFITQTSLFAG